MHEILPYPNISASDTKEQIAQINNYLLQLKEALEFILTDISVDNLSSDLVKKLNDMGSDIQKTQQEQNDQLQQVSRKSITVSDVINSAMFKAAVPSKYIKSVELKEGTTATYIFTDQDDDTVEIIGNEEEAI